MLGSGIVGRARLSSNLGSGAEGRSRVAMAAAGRGATSLGRLRDRSLAALSTWVKLGEEGRARRDSDRESQGKGACDRAMFSCDRVRLLDFRT